MNKYIIKYKYIYLYKEKKQINLIKQTLHVYFVESIN